MPAILIVATASGTNDKNMSFTESCATLALVTDLVGGPNKIEENLRQIVTKKLEANGVQVRMTNAKILELSREFLMALAKGAQTEKQIKLSIDLDTIV
jgi:hypothetical protein